MRQKLVAGNWKSNGNSQFVEQLIGALRAAEQDLSAGVDIVICPPALYMAQAGQMLRGSRIALGAQDVSPFPEGAYTGELAATMLQDIGCGYVIVGHSERRALLAETDALVREKVCQALENGLTPILCVGETLEQRQGGQAREVCQRQVVAAFGDLDPAHAEKLIVAYEPVWAIGTGECESEQQVQEVHHGLREVLADVLGQQAAETIKILYGGSVKAANAPALFALPDVDGGLIGGASLVAEEFLAICQAGSNA